MNDPNFSTPTPPLTTIFRPAPSCTNVVTYNGENFWQGELYEKGDLNCYPPFYSWARNKFYSPALCPDGWTSAGSVSGTGALVFSAAETNNLCCPSGYRAIAPSAGPTSVGNTIFCGSVITSRLTNVFPTATLTIGPLPADYTNSLTTVDPATLGIRPTVWAEMIQVRWQSTDSVILSLQRLQATSIRSSSTTSRTSTTSSSALSPTNPNPTSTGSQSTNNSGSSSNAVGNSSSGMSGGAIAGIVIGVVAVILLAAFGAIFLYRKRKQSTHRYEPPGPGPLVLEKYSGPPNQPPGELQGDYYAVKQQPPVEVAAGREYYATKPPTGPSQRVELAA